MAQRLQVPPVFGDQVDGAAGGLQASTASRSTTFDDVLGGGRLRQRGRHVLQAAQPSLAVAHPLFGLLGRLARGAFRDQAAFILLGVAPLGQIARDLGEALHVPSASRNAVSEPLGPNREPSLRTRQPRHGAAAVAKGIADQQ